MTLIIDWFLLIGVVVVDILTGKHLLGLGLIILLMLTEVICNGLNHSLFLVACEVLTAYLVVQETKRKGEDSPLIAYSPFNPRSRLPVSIRRLLLSVFILAFVVKAVDGLFFDRQVRQDKKGENDYINRIVDAYKKGEDYHRVANELPNDSSEFIKRVSSALVSEYDHVLDVKRNCLRLNGDVLTHEEKKSLLKELIRSCHCESSNVVERLRCANIGDGNVRNMSRDFISFYAKKIDLLKEKLKECNEE